MKKLLKIILIALTTLAACAAAFLFIFGRSVRNSPDDF